MTMQCYEMQYQNFGNCICIENDSIRLIATVDIGPRIIFFGTRSGRNIMFEDVARDFCELNKGYGTWFAYGGHRLWTAPELLPETYYPDNAKIDHEFNDGVLTLTQKPTPFGKQFKMEIRMSEGNSVQIVNSITNLTDQPQHFAPWSITSLSGGGTEIIPMCQAKTGYLPNRVMSFWSYTDVTDQRFTLTNTYAAVHHDEQAATPFKVGFNVTDGYAVYLAGGLMFRKSVAPHCDVRYPDFCCNFETYTNKYFIECETLGEERDYAPGESAVIEETWEITETGMTPGQFIASLESAQDQ